jgi:glycosyltransferase involved in cell wall biosynthesis
MLKVCHIITHLEMGGAQGNTLHTVQHLNRTEFSPILMSGVGGVWDGRAQSIPDLEWCPIDSMTREISLRHDMAALSELTRKLRRSKPHIVHTHCSKAGILGRWAARLAGVPVIIHTTHGFGFTPIQSRRTRSMLIAAERLTANRATAYIVVSKANWGDGARLGVFGRRPVHLIRSGVEIARFRLAAGETSRGMGKPRIGCVGNLNPQKAPLDFVRVAARVRSQYPNAEFILVGDGPLRQQVEEEIVRLELSESFSLLGLRQDIPQIMASLDVLVHTSRYEGLARVFPEAMASGLPIVATAVDGAKDVIVNGVNGYLCDPGDIDRLSERVVALLNNPSQARHIGSQNTEILAEFDIDNMVRRQEELYRSYAARAGIVKPLSE